MYFLNAYDDDGNEPKFDGEPFRRLMSLCFERSDFFSLTVGPWQNQVNTMQRELEPYIEKEIDTNHWFSYITPEYTMKRILYPANHETKNIIEGYFDSLWLRTDLQGRKQSLEDICFFSNDKQILGTVSHEYICGAFPPDDDFKSQLFDICNRWRESADSYEITYMDGKRVAHKSQIILSDYIDV
ncbi:MAG: hypothetical protein LBH17_00100 [Oscillospiraceae bacterium]|jgi:hypothetical protein|nr:hypothetical protein [Oscillospiraceae bacterium]